MTRDEIVALPAEELPRALCTAGLKPLGMHIDTTMMDYLRALHHRPTLWQPHVRWDHAAPLLERFRMNVEYLRSLEHWIVLVDGWTHYGAVPFVQIPAMICRTALSVHDATHWAQPEEAAPHGE